MDGYKRNYIVINRQRLLSILCFVAVGAIIGLTRYSESKIYVKVTNATNFTLNPELYSLQLIRVRDFLNICLECDGSPRSDKVMSFTIFGDSTNQDTKDRFFEPLKLTLSSVGNLYPGWEIRIYYHPNIQHVVAGLSNVRLCNVMALPFTGTDLPASHIDLSWINPRVWRFLPLLDDYVSVFLSRDSDSIILKREVSAVEEWLNFNRSFHVMRDHPQHGAAILAGMWGARLDKRRKEIREAAVDMVLSSQDDLKSTDQRQLEYRIWPIAKSDSVVHDSYFCKNHRLRSRDITLPFPTRRENYTFVGNVVNMSEYLFEECPEECRPVEHKEWYFC